MLVLLSRTKTKIQVKLKIRELEAEINSDQEIGRSYYLLLGKIRALYWILSRNDEIE